MNRALNAPGIAQPFSAYAHAVEVTEPARWLHVSGQVGAAADGTVPADAREQMRLCWDNVFAVLAAGGMSKRNIVKVTAMLTDPADTGLYRELRDAALEGLETASTLLIVAGLAHPDWRVEIEVTAAA